jgi:Flp pilus assembly protein TadG
MRRIRGSAGLSSDVLLRPLRAFARCEQGTLLVFGLFIFVLMLMAGGLAVDLMRHEAERTRVQNTADRAVLAAAALRQELEPEAVVQNYFAIEGLAGNLTGVAVDEGLNFRNVRATTAVAVGTYFMKLLGIDTLQSASGSAAEERITNVEIVLVLDVTGSMGSNNRLVNLKSAADEFITQILRDDADNRISIAIVPYNAQVNLGPHLINYFNVTERHSATNSFCVDEPASVYNHVTLSQTLAMPQASHVDFSSSSNSGDSYQTPQAPVATSIVCQPFTRNFIVPPTNNQTLLRTTIQNFVANGQTSIYKGLRWGAVFLDPAAQPIVAGLASQGQVPTYFANRPFAFTDPETLKVIVLMTDGDHVSSWRTRPAVRSGPSPIYRSRNNNRYSIFHASRTPPNQFWVPHLNNGAGEWRSTPFSDGGVDQLDWRDVWAQLRASWVARQLYARAFGNSSSQYNSAMNSFREQTSVNNMNTQLNTLCTHLKAQNVVIFGVAFEAPPQGVTAIRNCASPGLFYDVQGLEIATAFRTIRAQISKLRLTQ